PIIHGGASVQALLFVPVPACTFDSSHRRKVLRFYKSPFLILLSKIYADMKVDYDIKVSGVEISPYPVARGKETTFSIAASTIYFNNRMGYDPSLYPDKAVSGGKLVIDVSYFGWQIHSESHDLCSETSCPVSVGDFMISHSQVLPGFTPPVSHFYSLETYMARCKQGSYSLKMRMVDDKKHQLTCIGFDFSIGFVASDNVAES
ncbi:hypothetical protein RJ639_036165, partial [Escallonia herrerae]